MTIALGYKTFLSSTQLSIKFIMPINVKMTINFGILTIISMINRTSMSSKARKFFIFSILVFLNIKISYSIELSMKQFIRLSQIALNCSNGSLASSDYSNETYVVMIVQ